MTSSDVIETVIAVVRTACSLVTSACVIETLPLGSLACVIFIWRCAVACCLHSTVAALALTTLGARREGRGSAKGGRDNTCVGIVGAC